MNMSGTNQTSASQETINSFTSNEISTSLQENFTLASGKGGAYCLILRKNNKHIVIVKTQSSC
jgi:hypothetical protein